MPLHHHVPDDQDQELLQPGSLLRDIPIPRHRIGEHTIDASHASRLIRDELLLDGVARLNLATFVTTWMEDEATQLMSDAAEKNMIDKDEYPQTAELERRCVNILADLWNAPGGGDATGCSTTGSSEAAMLAGMALLRRWRARRKAAGLPFDKPNLVMGANVQVCWEKFCRYWDVDAVLVPAGPETHLTAPKAAAAVDENSIGVVAVLGSTFDGIYEPVAEISAALDELAASGGPDVPLHVDGASGGFIAPFLDQDLVWDFKLDRVQSINASGHKYGLVYPGVGWVVWRNKEALPEELVFHVSYLGGDMPTFALNFSRPGSQVVAQYYTFLRYGRPGFTAIQQGSRDTADWLAEEIGKIPCFEVITDGLAVPVFSFKSTDPEVSVYAMSKELRSRGWQVPAYPMPEGMEDVHVLRIVIRHGFTRDMAGLLLHDIRHSAREVKGLEHAPTSGFHH